jgi:hypothetical protein
MKKIAKQFIIGVLLFVSMISLMPQQALAESIFQTKIIPCGYSGAKNEDTTSAEDCNLCHLFVMMRNIIQLAFALAGFVAVLMIVIAGTLYIVGPSISQQYLAMGKTALTYTVIGFFIIAIAFTMISSLMKSLGFQESVFNNPFTNIQSTCQDEKLFNSQPQNQ